MKKIFASKLVVLILLAASAFSVHVRAEIIDGAETEDPSIGGFMDQLPSRRNVDPATNPSVINSQAGLADGYFCKDCKKDPIGLNDLPNGRQGSSVADTAGDDPGSQ